MKRNAVFVLLASLIMLCGLFPVVYCGPYRNYAGFMTALMNLTNSHPGVMTAESMGKSVDGVDIMMFKIGNPQGERILFDGAIHGWESQGGEILYDYAEWLLTNNSQVSRTILTNMYTLLIPALNPDEYNIQRQNAHGVDLNRNFPPGWAAGSPDPNNEYYRGPSSLSEPESQALAKALGTYDPSFYVNLHAGGGTMLYGTYYGNLTSYSLIFKEIDSASKEFNVTPYQHTIVGAPGEAMSYAATLGTTSFVLELGNQSIPLSDLETRVFPRFLPVAVTLSSMVITPRGEMQFKDDFESGDFSAWDGLHLSPGSTASVTMTLPREGQYSALFALNGSSTDERADCYKNLPPSPEIVAGAYFLVNSSGITANEGFLYFIMVVAGNNSVGFAGWSHSQGAVHWRLKIQNETGWTYVDSSSSPTPNHWYYVELHWNEDVTNGTGELYVDGVAVCQISSQNTGAYGNVDSVHFGLPASYNSGWTAIFCDSVQVTGASSSYLPWDLNHDGKVDGEDIAIVALAYGSVPGSSNWNPLADLNGDGKVDGADIALVAAHFGE